jgi:hypothetical protein
MVVTELATLTVAQKLLRSRFGSIASHLSTQAAFEAQMGRVFSAGHPLSADEAADQWSLITYAGGNEILDKLSLYARERLRYAARWHAALRTWTGTLELAWGLQDPVCTRSALDAVLELRPDAPASVTEIIVRLAEAGSIVPSGA